MKKLVKITLAVALLLGGAVAVSQSVNQDVASNDPGGGR